MREIASATAMKPPVIAAVRVPPSAWITSQSTHTEPSGCRRKSRVTVIGRSWSGARPSGRGISGGPRALVPVPPVLGEAGEDRARDLVPVARVFQALLLARIGDETDLDQDGRH